MYQISGDLNLPKNSCCPEKSGQKIEMQKVLLGLCEESYGEIKALCLFPGILRQVSSATPRSLELIMLPCMGLSLKPQQKHSQEAEVAQCLRVQALEA